MTKPPHGLALPASVHPLAWMALNNNKFTAGEETKPKLKSKESSTFKPTEIWKGKALWRLVPHEGSKTSLTQKIRVKQARNLLLASSNMYQSQTHKPVLQVTITQGTSKLGKTFLSHPYKGNTTGSFVLTRYPKTLKLSQGDVMFWHEHVKFHRSYHQATLEISRSQRSEKKPTLSFC